MFQISYKDLNCSLAQHIMLLFSCYTPRKLLYVLNLSSKWRTKCLSTPFTYQLHARQKKYLLRRVCPGRGEARALVGRRPRAPRHRVQRRLQHRRHAVAVRRCVTEDRTRCSRVQYDTCWHKTSLIHDKNRDML